MKIRNLFSNSLIITIAHEIQDVSTSTKETSHSIMHVKKFEVFNQNRIKLSSDTNSKELPLSKTVNYAALITFLFQLKNHLLVVGLSENSRYSGMVVFGSLSSMFFS